MRFDHKPTYTIVPGQIQAAAEQRNIIPCNVYGDTWVASAGFTVEEEKEIEESYYYKDDSSDNEHNTENDEDDSLHSEDCYEDDTDYGNEGPFSGDEDLESYDDMDLDGVKVDASYPVEGADGIIINRPCCWLEFPDT